MPKLVCVRHGQSVWNLQNKFTGWVDVDLTEKGVNEAISAGDKLKGYHFDNAFSSLLKRANRTLDFILKGIGQDDLHVERNENLNERMYGDLQGKNKDEVSAEFGAEQVNIWRRSYDIPPPGGESLKDTRERVIPYYLEHIEPVLRSGKDVIIVAHGNSLRALVMHLEQLSPEEILLKEISTGTPYIYDLSDDLKITSAEFI
ncbi:MAG: 2,3-bisphosphoglycerate-dependent phosphoglycerate mutase [Salibacteraceae bacterium]|nr:2,3-bisphosphoglycerate-dependent phosphoglycerate mutase [Salibacteraceae bacterium]|tara:strand:- start:5840 stop:6445 length:606 start_codon:yes stop_codon:yes gene_type:complete